MKRSLVLLAYCAAASLVACGESTREPQSRGPVRERRPTVIAWDTLWMRGGPADTLLLMPLDVVANDDHVYVLDGGGKRVVALRADDGALAWVVGGAGGGPQEFAAPTALTLTPSGEVLVADHQNARISVIGPAGRVTAHIPMREFAYAQGICALSDGDLVVTTMEAERPVIRLSRDGVIKQRVDLPWPELRETAPLARQAFLSSTDDFQSCALALATGRGFAVYQGDDFTTASDYVEAVAAPEIEVSQRGTDAGKATSTRMRRPDIAATDVVAGGGTLAVSFKGRSAAAGRIIDHYDLRTGLYAESYEFTSPIISLARSRNRYLLLHYSAGYPTLVAAVPAARAADGTEQRISANR